MIQNATSSLDYSFIKIFKNNADLESLILCIISQKTFRKLSIHDFIAQGMEHKIETDFEQWLMSLIFPFFSKY
jgi:hypothetical protein